MKIISVINNRVVNPFKVLFREIRHGHVKLAFMRFFASLFNGTVIARNLLGNVDQYILNYLEREYSYVLENIMIIMWGQCILMMLLYGYVGCRDMNKLLL